MKQIFIYFIVLFLINNSLAKKNKDSDIIQPKINSVEITRDNYPYNIEITLIGQFSNDKTGFTLIYDEDKITRYSYKKGEAKTVNVTTTPSATPSPTNTPSNTPSKTSKPTQTPSQTSKPTNTPSNTPTSTPTTKPEDNTKKQPEGLKKSHLIQKKNDKDKKDKKDKKTPSPSPTFTPSNSPSVAPSNSPSIAPSNSPSIAPSNSPSVAPSNSPSIAPSNSPSTIPSNSPSVTPKPDIEKSSSDSSLDLNSSLDSDSSFDSDDSSLSEEENYSSDSETPVQTTTPQSTSIVKEFDKVSFNVTDFSNLDAFNITIKYKNGMETSILFKLTSTIKEITRVNNSGGLIDIVGRFITSDDDSSIKKPLKPIVTIGKQICETISSNQTYIKCYLPPTPSSSNTYQSGCGDSIVIENIQSFNSSTYQYCYANPIIDKVIGIPNEPNKPQTKIITIIGHNFNLNPYVYLEKSSKVYIGIRKCENILLSTDTTIICELNSTYHINEKRQTNNNKLLKSSPNEDIHYSLFVLNSPLSNLTIDQIKSKSNYNYIVGEYDFNKQQQQQTNNSSSSNTLDFEYNDRNSEKNTNNNNHNSNSNNRSEDTKFYLLIIIPSVLFIVIIVLIAVFVKTRAKGKDKIPFLVLNDIGHETNFSEKELINPI